MQLNQKLNIVRLLTASLFIIAIVYYIFLTPQEILNIVQEEYIFLIISLLLFVSFLYFKLKLKGLEIISYIADINTVELKTTLLFFLLFQGVDFYFEDGFKGMISQWFIYFIFGVLAYLVTSNINFYKNYQFYKKI